MSATVLGQIIAPNGWAHHTNTLGEVVRSSVCEPIAYQRHQPADLPVYFAHDDTWRLGRVRHLERSNRFGLVAVATLDADVADLLADGPWYWSDRMTCRHVSLTPQRSDAQLVEVSLVRATANCGTRPVVSAPGDLLDGEPRTGLTLWQRDTWQRAALAVEATRYRTAPDHLDIVDLDPLDLVDEWRTDPDAGKARLRATIDSRQAAKLAPVSRTVDDQFGRVYRHSLGGRVAAFD
jgi:hypothetical protein